MYASSAFAARQPASALPPVGWPRALVDAFSLRMSDHGHSVSSTLMLFDHGYAVQQLAHAHTLADDALRALAMELFRQFEAMQARPAHLN